MFAHASTPPKGASPTPPRRLLHLMTQLAAALAGGLAPVVASGIIILDDTWREEGGAPGKEWAGFSAHETLAAQPQFAGVLSFATRNGKWGEASGTWLGNDERHAYVLTAAHIYEGIPADPREYSLRDGNGNEFQPDKLWMHPLWNRDLNLREGYDLAILRIPRPLANLGEPPLLYTGSGEHGQLLTFVGYGNRGIGSLGEDERYSAQASKTAAQGVVDGWADLDHNAAMDESAGNYLGIYLAREDGSLENPLGGDARPRSRLAGLLGSGDSGGPAWMQVRGQWVLVGVSSNGVGSARYGDTSWFVRVSPHQAWIRNIFPGARFTE